MDERSAYAHVEVYDFEPIDRFVLNRFGPASSVGRATEEVIAFMWTADGGRVSRPANINIWIYHFASRTAEKLICRKSSQCAAKSNFKNENNNNNKKKYCNNEYYIIHFWVYIYLTHRRKPRNWVVYFILFRFFISLFLSSCRLAHSAWCHRIDIHVRLYCIAVIIVVIVKQQKNIYEKKFAHSDNPNTPTADTQTHTQTAEYKSAKALPFILLLLYFRSL